MIDVGRDATYEFLDVVIGELADMYRRAGVPLEYVHLGGDEVPKGAWEASPACRRDPDARPKALARPTAGDLFPEAGVRHRRNSTAQRPPAGTTACCSPPPTPIGRSARWRMSGTMSGVGGARMRPIDWRTPASTSCWRTRRISTSTWRRKRIRSSPAIYWAGFVDMRAPFEFNPFDVYQNARAQLDGRAAGSRSIRQECAPDACRAQAHSRHPRTTLGRKSPQPSAARIHGLSAHDRACRTSLGCRTRICQRLLTRKLAPPLWPSPGTDLPTCSASANCRGSTDSQAKSVTEFRRQVPSSAKASSSANVAFPGLTIRYTLDGSDPTPTSLIWKDAVASPAAEIRLRAFDAHGHGSRTQTIFTSPLDH